MTIELCERCGGTGAHGTCEMCEGTGSIDVVESPAPNDFPTPQPSLPLAPKGFVRRPNFCGGRYWQGYAWTQCQAEALPGETRCQRCKDHEKHRNETRAKQAAEAPQKGRRRHA